MTDTTQVVDTDTRSGTGTGTGTGDRVAVITQARGGVGRAVTRLLLSNGSRVFAIDRDTPGADDVAGERYYPAELDVREPGALAQARQTLVDRWSAPNLIIVNAGLYRPDHATTEAVDWDELFDVSGRGVVETVRVFLPDLLAAADAGRLADLVVIGAIPSESEHTDSTIFTAAAAAIGWFMSGLRARFQERGLRVSHVAPGYVDTARPQTISDTDTEPQPREALRPSDFADIIGFALDQPAEVSIGEMVLVSTPSA